MFTQNIQVEVYKNKPLQVSLLGIKRFKQQYLIFLEKTLKSDVKLH